MAPELRQEKRTRRLSNTEYKLKIHAEADAYPHGEIEWAEIELNSAVLCEWPTVRLG